MAENREKVSPEMLEKAKNEGVVQQKLNGKWGIISIQAGEWWVADYDSKEAADAALKAYHAQRGEFDSLSQIKSQLFDAPSDVKLAFNDIVEYFGYESYEVAYYLDDKMYKVKVKSSSEEKAIDDVKRRSPDNAYGFKVLK